jgi:putative restriction endonuclease
VLVSDTTADTVDAHLRLTEAQARAQWQSIRQRVPLARQVAFLPIETLLCYALFYQLNPHKFGGGNIDEVPPEVKVLAATFTPPSERELLHARR